MTNQTGVNMKFTAKKIALGIAIISSLSASPVFAKQVTICTSYFASATTEMECQGHFKGKASFVKLYQSGWRHISSVPGVAHKFMFIFEK